MFMYNIEVLQRIERNDDVVNIEIYTLNVIEGQKSYVLVEKWYQSNLIYKHVYGIIAALLHFVMMG